MNNLLNNFYFKIFSSLHFLINSLSPFLEKDMVSFLLPLDCTPLLINCLDSIRSNVEKALVKYYDKFIIGVKLFGSSHSRICTNDSDIDLILLSVFDLDIGEIAEKLSIEGFGILLVLKYARVPIVKFNASIEVKDENNKIVTITKQCDLSFNHPFGLYNSELIKMYCEMDERVRPLILLIKKWAKVQEIGEASKATLSMFM
jgi:DNA polymerase sigma